MSLITGEKVSKKFDDKVILKDVSFQINTGSRIALVGRNGIGKSAMLDILTERLKPDTGTVYRSKGLRIDYVQQSLEDFEDQTLREFAAGARPDILELNRRLEELGHRLADDPENGELVAKYDEAQRHFEGAGGFDFDSQVEITLLALGFERERLDTPLTTFSGGERNRASLGRALLGNGDLLLLDEPTNHLDIQTTEWLEKTLQGTQRAFVLVSHDRAILEAVTQTIWELSFGSLDVYHNGFKAYLEESRERRELRQKEYERQREFIERTEHFIRKNIAGQKTKQAQSRRKMLARLQRIEAPKGAEAAPKISVESAGRSFGHVLAAQNVAIGYGGSAFIEEISFDLYRGDRVGLIGPNGSGKSTLLKTLLGEIDPIDGEVRIGNNVELAYFDQTLSELTDELSPLEHIWRIDQLTDQGAARSYLARYGFYGDEAFQLVGTFSGGEKTKLALALLLYEPSNFLVLDEPTNHLDIESREALQSALLEYGGACLIVSHDRHFLEQVTTKTLSIENDALREYGGPYSYYLMKRTERESSEQSYVTKDKSEFLSFKERSRRKSQLEKQIKSNTTRISEFERKLRELEAALHNGIPRSDWEKLTETSAEKTSIEMTLLELYQEQEDLKSELETFEVES